MILPSMHILSNKNVDFRSKVTKEEEDCTTEDSNNRSATFQKNEIK
jgi:hypothetical protein